jgi:hypothetical protein
MGISGGGWRDIAAVIGFAHLSFMMAYLISGAVVLMEKSHPGQMKSPVWLDLVVLWTIYFPSAPILSYLSAKMGRCLCSRWRIRIQRDTMTIGVRVSWVPLAFTSEWWRQRWRFRMYCSSGKILSFDTRSNRCPMGRQSRSEIGSRSPAIHMR